MILFSTRGKQQFQWSDHKVAIFYRNHLLMDYNSHMSKTNTKTEYQVVRNFFTDDQWDVIDMALNEFQDHDDYVEVLDTIGDKLQTVFDNSVDQSEGN